MDKVAHAIDKHLELTKYIVKGVPIGITRLVQEPAADISLRELSPGTTFEWMWWHDEMHIVVKGKAEIEFYLPPLYLEPTRVVTEEGDGYLIYRKENLTFKVISDQPYRYLSVIMPAIPLVGNYQLIRDSYYAWKDLKQE